MNMMIAPSLRRPRAVREFSLQGSTGRNAGIARVMHGSRLVATVQARTLQAQFRLSDGSTLLLAGRAGRSLRNALLLASSDEPFHEQLCVLLLGPDLRQRELLRIGGATTPGFLAYAESHGPDEVAFCWHDLEQVVSVRARRRFFGLQTRWLSVRDLVPQRRVRAPRR